MPDIHFMQFCKAICALYVDFRKNGSSDIHQSQIRGDPIKYTVVP